MPPIPVRAFKQVLDNNIFPLVSAFPLALSANIIEGIAGVIEVHLEWPDRNRRDLLDVIRFEAIENASRSEGQFIEFTKRIMDDLSVKVRARRNEPLQGDYTYAITYKTPLSTAPPLTAEILEQAIDKLNVEEAPMFFPNGAQAAFFAGRRGGKTEQVLQNMQFALGRQWIKPGELEDVDDPVPVVDLDPVPMGLVRPARAYLDD